MTGANFLFAAALDSHRARVDLLEWRTSVRLPM